MHGCTFFKSSNRIVSNADSNVGASGFFLVTSLLAIYASRYFLLNHFLFSFTTTLPSNAKSTRFLPSFLPAEQCLSIIKSSGTKGLVQSMISQNFMLGRGDGSDQSSSSLCITQRIAVIMTTIRSPFINRFFLKYSFNANCKASFNGVFVEFHKDAGPILSNRTSQRI